MKFFPTVFAALLFSTIAASTAQTMPGSAPLRVAIAGMVHGHVEGFLQHSLHRGDIQIVGIAEADRQVARSHQRLLLGQPLGHVVRAHHFAGREAGAGRR